MSVVYLSKQIQILLLFIAGLQILALAAPTKRCDKGRASARHGSGHGHYDSSQTAQVSGQPVQAAQYGPNQGDQYAQASGQPVQAAQYGPNQAGQGSNPGTVWVTVTRSRPNAGQGASRPSTATVDAQRPGNAQHPSAAPDQNSQGDQDNDPSNDTDNSTPTTTTAPARTRNNPSTAAPPTTTADTTQSSGGDDWFSISSKWRTAGGLAPFSKDTQLMANSLDTLKTANGGHKLNPGSFGQTLAPGGPEDFTHVYVGGWLCEKPSLPGLNGICATESNGWVYSGTGHADILTGGYKKIGCSNLNGQWACDFA